MPQKTKDYSLYLLSVGALLYFFGFLTITAFLARFGIVNFEIINARYIIAGILSSISVCLVTYSAWYFYKVILLNKIFRSGEWHKRIVLYSAFIVESYSLSLIMTQLLNIGKYSSPAPVKDYKPLLGKYDFVGNLLTKINVPRLTPGYSSALKDYLNIAIYLTALLLLVMPVIYIVKKVFNISNKSQKKKIDIEKKTTKKIVSQESKFSTVALILESLAILFVFLVYEKTFIIYKANLFDFQTFTQIELTTQLYFAWFFNSTFSLYLFLNIFKVPRVFNHLKKIKFATLLNNLPVNSIAGLIQMGVIPVLGSIILFGQLIYPRIPYTIGGGQPQEIYLDWQNSMYEISKDGRYFLIGETPDFLYVVNISGGHKPQALQINKGGVHIFATKKGEE